MHPEIRQLIESPRHSIIGRLLGPAPVGVSIGVDAKIVYANEVCARMWGFSDPSEMLDLPFFRLIAEDLHPMVIDLWRSREPDSTEPWTYRLVGVRTDGERFDYECTSVPLEVGAAKGTLAFLREL